MDQAFSYLLWPKREVHTSMVDHKNNRRKNRGLITCCIDQANEVNKAMQVTFEQVLNLIISWENFTIHTKSLTVHRFCTRLCNFYILYTVIDIKVL